MPRRVVTRSGATRGTRNVSMALLSLLTLARCSPADLLNATVSRSGLTITHDIAYGPGPREKLDIYRPANAANLPVVVFFYGGRWSFGSRSTYPFVAATLARRGNVVIVPDYRLYPEVRFPAFLNDCAAAVAWTSAHMAEFGGDPKRLFLMGHSAGAYNAAMLAVDPALLEAAGTSRARIAGFIGLAGPYDFLPLTDDDVKDIFSPANDGPASQPVTYVDGHAPPMLLLAGTDDTTVRPRNSLSLARHVQEKGGEATVKQYKGLAHIGLVTAIAPLFQRRAPVLDDIETFIQAHQVAS